MARLTAQCWTAIRYAATATPVPGLLAMEQHRLPSRWWGGPGRGAHLLGPGPAGRAARPGRAASCAQPSVPNGRSPGTRFGPILRFLGPPCSSSPEIPGLSNPAPTLKASPARRGVKETRLLAETGRLIALNRTRAWRTLGRENWPGEIAAFREGGVGKIGSRTLSPGVLCSQGGRLDQNPLAEDFGVQTSEEAQ